MRTTRYAPRDASPGRVGIDTLGVTVRIPWETATEDPKPLCGKRLGDFASRFRSGIVTRMKCQRCDKPATFHITELTGGKPQELHLCEQHARVYLTESEPEQSGTQNLAGALAQQLAVGQTAEELARLDQQACPICGITFFEFRKEGRLGCPHDYVCFQKELEPLIMNIHGELQHVGKRPRAVAGQYRSSDRFDSLAARNERSDYRRRLRARLKAAGRNSANRTGDIGVNRARAGHSAPRRPPPTYATGAVCSPRPA